MAGTLTLQTIADNERLLVVKAHFASTGTDEADLTIINASEYNPVYTRGRLEKIWVSATGDFAAELLWDADVNVPIIAIPPNAHNTFDWCEFGGLPNNALVGRTGDILLTTTGIASGDLLTIIFKIVKDDG